jgi:hypothetical protein
MSSFVDLPLVNLAHLFRSRAAARDPVPSNASCTAAQNGQARQSIKTALTCASVLTSDAASGAAVGRLEECVCVVNIDNEQVARD